VGFFSRDEPDSTADGDHLQSRTRRDGSNRSSPETVRYPRKADRPDPNFAVESPGRAQLPKDPKGYIER
jgi:hypothetical protein